MLYIIGILFLFAGLLSYGNQDQARYFDAGESKMAAAILSRHGKMMTSCVQPGAGDWCPRTNSSAPLDPPATMRFSSFYMTNELAPGAVAIDSIASVVQGAPAAPRLFTFGFVQGGAGSNRASVLRPTIVASHLSHYLTRYGEAGLEQRSGIYDEAARVVRFTDRKTPISVPFDRAVAGIVIPDNAPVMVSPVMTPALP